MSESPADHYAWAEALIAQASDQGDFDRKAHLIAVAQIHATLATCVTRPTPVVHQLIVDSHGATFTTPRYRWDYRRPGAWLPLSMRDHGPPAFEPDYSRAWMWPVVPERKTWRGWWGTLQRTDMTEAATATRETP